MGDMEVREKVTNPFSGETRTIPDGVVIRAGKASDQPSIRQLCKEVQFYDNWDYLPWLWTRFIEDPKYLMVVGVKEGKVLAVSGMFVLNKGQSWLECANRSSPTIRGNNVFWACNAQRIALGLKQYGLPAKMCLMTGNFKDAMKARHNGKNYRVVRFNHFMFAGYAMNAESVQTLSDHVTSSVTSPTEVHAVPSAAEFAELLSDTDKQFALFPEGYFHMAYSCFEAVPQSAYDIFDSCPLKWVAISKTQNDELTLSIVIHFTVSEGEGVVLHMELYGYVDDAVLWSHLKFHLPQMLKAFEGCKEMYLLLEAPCDFCFKPYAELFHNKMKLSDGGFGICTAVAVECDAPKMNT